MRLKNLVTALFRQSDVEQASARVMTAIQNGNSSAVTQEYQNLKLRNGLVSAHYYKHVEAAIQTGNVDVFKALFAVVDNNPFYQMRGVAIGPIGASTFRRPDFRTMAISARQEEILNVITDHMPNNTVIQVAPKTFIPVRTANELELKL